MCDSEGAHGRVIRAVPSVNEELFLAALRAKGCTREGDRARLLKMPRRSVNRYLKNEVDPKLSTARWIAQRLGVSVEELWPDDRHDGPVAA